MPLTKLVIEKFGLSKTVIARFVGANVNTLNKYTFGLRDLTVDANLKLLLLYNFCAKLPPVLPPTPTEKEKTKLLKDADWYLAQCHPLEKKLAAVKEKYIEATNTLHMLEAKEITLTDTSERRQRWLQIMRDDATTKLEANGWQAQNKLQLTIYKLQDQAKRCREAVGVNE